MGAVLYGIVQFLLRQVVLKFILMGIIFEAVGQMGTILLDLVNSHVSVGILDGAVGQITGAVWWFLQLFSFSYGCPTIVGAALTRFLVRRIPVIG